MYRWSCLSLLSTSLVQVSNSVYQPINVALTTFVKGHRRNISIKLYWNPTSKFRKYFFFEDWQFFYLSNAAATKVWPHLAQFRTCPMLDGDKCSDKRSIKLDTKCNLYTVNPFPHIDTFWHLCDKRLLKTRGPWWPWIAHLFYVICHINQTVNQNNSLGQN